MTVTITGPISGATGQVSGTTSTADRTADLDATTSGTTAAPPAGATATPVATPRPVTLPPVVATGETVLEGESGRRAGYGPVNRGQIRKELSHLANAVKHELKTLAKSADLGESAEHELRTLARTFKTTVKSIFEDVKGDVGTGELDGDAVLSDVRAAYDEVRAAATGLLAPTDESAAADDDAVVAGPGTGVEPDAPADADGDPVGPIEPATVVADGPGATDGSVADPLSALDAVFDGFLSSLSELLARFVTESGPADDDASAAAPAATADGSLYARVADGDDGTGGFDASA